MLLKVCGCRGSAPVSHYGASKYGGNTSCFILETAGGSLVMDAGSGLLKAGPLSAPINILLSHLHLDHIIGLTSFNPIWDKNGGVKIFTRRRADTDIKSQVFGVFKRPYWPVDMDKAAFAEVVEVIPGVPFSPDGAHTVTFFDAMHPDGTDSFKITDGDKTLVHLLDYEISALTEPGYDSLVEECWGADMIIFDAAYHPDDYPAKRGWGHSTVCHGVRLAEDCRCAKMMFSHYSFDYTDEELDKWPGLLEGVSRKERFLFARDGMETEI